MTAPDMSGWPASVREGYLRAQAAELGRDYDADEQAVYNMFTGMADSMSEQRRANWENIKKKAAEKRAKNG